GQYAVNVSGRGRVSGKVLEIIPERRLVVSWGWEDWSLPLPPGQSTVEITLQPDGEGTRLRLTHNALPPDMRAFHRRGWDYALPPPRRRCSRPGPGTRPPALDRTGHRDGRPLAAAPLPVPVRPPAIATTTVAPSAVMTVVPDASIPVAAAASRLRHPAP